MSLLLLFAGSGGAGPGVTSSVQIGRQMGIHGGIGGVISWLRIPEVMTYRG